MTRWTVGLLVVISMLAGTVGPAAAGGGDGPGGGAGRTDTGAKGQVYYPHSGGGTTSPPGASNPLTGCRWIVINWMQVILSGESVYDYLGMVPNMLSWEYNNMEPHTHGRWSPDEDYVALVCDASSNVWGSALGTPAAGGAALAETWPLGDPPPLSIIDGLVEWAYSLLEVPVHQGESVPAGDSAAPFITQLATWLRVEDDAWVVTTATTPDILGYSVTVTATPTNVVFSGAGQSVDCGANTGPAYNFALSEDAQSSDCTLTYRDSSAVGSWNVDSVVTWEFDWVCAPGCGGGTLAPLGIGNIRDVTVAELQGVLQEE